MHLVYLVLRVRLDKTSFDDVVLHFETVRENVVGHDCGYLLGNYCTRRKHESTVAVARGCCCVPLLSYC